MGLCNSADRARDSLGDFDTLLEVPDATSVIWVFLIVATALAWRAARQAFAGPQGSFLVDRGGGEPVPRPITLFNLTHSFPDLSLCVSSRHTERQLFRQTPPLLPLPKQWFI